SVFVETQVTTGPAAAASDPNSTPTQFGSTSAFSTVVEGRKITAVGEVPPETVRAIANSLQSVGGPPAATAPPFNPNLPQSVGVGPRQPPQSPPPAMSLQGTPKR